MKLSNALTLMVSLNGLQVIASAAGSAQANPASAAGGGVVRSSAASASAAGGGIVPSVAAPPASLVGQTAGPFILGLERQHPNLYTSQYSSQAMEMFQKIKNSFPLLDVPILFKKVINHSNLVTFEVLIELKYNPFLKGYDRLDALDILESLSAGRTPNQNRMFQILSEQFSASSRILGREAGNIHTMRSLYDCRSEASLDMDTWEQGDGSTLAHQIVIGGSKAKMQLLLANVAHQDKLNNPWVAVPNSGDTSQELYFNPGGWTPEMLAVALNRVEIVQAMSLSYKFKFELGHNGLDPLTLTLNLAEAERIAMLKALCVVVHYFTPFQTFSKIEDGFVNYSRSISILIKYYINKVIAQSTNRAEITSAAALFGPFVNVNTIKEAIEKLTPAALDTFLDITSPYSDSLIRGNPLEIWNSLKAIPSTVSAQDIKLKFISLSRKSFKMISNGAPFLNFLESTPENIYLIDIVLQRMININATGFDPQDELSENLLISAIKKQNVPLIKRILINRKSLGLELDTTRLRRLPLESGEENRSGEGYIHYAINEFDAAREVELIEIVKTLIEIAPSYLELKPVHASKTKHSYNLTNAGLVVGLVSYDILRSLNWTPLMYAVVARKDELAKELVRKGANLNALTHQGNCVDRICRERVDAFQLTRDAIFGAAEASRRSRVSVENQVAVDATKMLTIRKKTKILVNQFKRNLEDTLKI